MTEEQFQALFLAERLRCIDAAMAEYEPKEVSPLAAPACPGGLGGPSGQLERCGRAGSMSPSIGGAGTMKL